MKINLDNFKSLFFEESEEGLAHLEDVVVHLSVEENDVEKINDIFRAVHSMKGGGGTFGFEKLVGLAHRLEAYLDLVRNNQLSISQEGIDAMIGAVDILRLILKNYKNNESVDDIETKDLIEKLDSLMKGGEIKLDLPNKKNDSNVQDKIERNIFFSPHKNIFLSGNDPIRFVRELKIFGDLKVSTDLNLIPSLDELDPDISYLKYNIYLNSHVSESEIREVFVWIEDECDLSIVEIKKEVINTVPSKKNEPVIKKRNEDEKNLGQDEKSSIRVNVEKIDQLLNLVGELVITESILSQVGKKISNKEEASNLQEGLQILEQTIRELQESVMRIRMVPINNIFSRAPRIVYDLSKKLGKEVELKIFGEQTELDKTVLEKVGDPLIHLVRNALDHGLEKTEERIKNKKSPKGTLKLSAYHHSGSIIIEVSDNGRGIDKEKVIKKAIENGLITKEDEITEQKIYQLIFEPGFSTAEQVSEVSGRGVGMDVVKKNIQSLGGSVKVKTKVGEGTDFIIQLPLTLAILDAQLIKVCDEIFIVPLINICETIQVNEKDLKTVSGHQMVYQFRDEFIPVLKLHQIICDKKTKDLDGKFWDEKLLIVVEEGNSKTAITVDELLNQQQVVIKTLEENFKKLKGISGATILGDGTVSLILDVPELVNFL